MELVIELNNRGVATLARKSKELEPQEAKALVAAINSGGPMVLTCGNGSQIAFPAEAGSLLPPGAKLVSDSELAAAQGIRNPATVTTNQTDQIGLPIVVK